MYCSAYCGSKAASSMRRVFRFSFCRRQKRCWPAKLPACWLSALNLPVAHRRQPLGQGWQLLSGSRWCTPAASVMQVGGQQAAGVLQEASSVVSAARPHQQAHVREQLVTPRRPGTVAGQPVCLLQAPALVCLQLSTHLSVPSSAQDQLLGVPQAAAGSFVWPPCTQSSCSAGRYAGLTLPWPPAQLAGRGRR